MSTAPEPRTLSLADTGDSTTWYSYAALGAAAFAGVLGVVGLVRSRRARRS